MINTIFNEFIKNNNYYFELLTQHILIVFITAFLATFIGLFIGILISKTPKISKVIIGIINVLYTIPSIALLGVLITITGIGNTTAIIALTIYGLLPIVRSTYVGLNTIDKKIIEASVAMGSKEIQVLFNIKLPLAFPVIFQAIRNMLIMTIALASIASFVGAGGLGVAIYRGITTNNSDLIFVGSILIALMAIIIDGVLGIFEKLVKKNKFKKRKNKLILLFSFITLLLIILIGLIIPKTIKNNNINLATKPTTENYILGEIVKKLIENDTNLKVNITHGVGGGTSNIHPAIVKKDFDIYQEYTGTSWQVVLKKSDIYTNDKFNILKEEYEKKYNLTYKGMFGFNNTYSLGIRKELSQKYNIKTISDLSNHSNKFIFGAEFDFFGRQDGYEGLKKAYNLNFKSVNNLDIGLKYKALLDKKIDVMTVFTTDGQLSNPNIYVLKDDKNFYPKYLAGNVVRLDILKKYPTLNKVFEKLENLINEETMIKLNKLVEIEKQDPKDVAIKFLKEKGLISDKNEKIN